MKEIICLLDLDTDYEKKFCNTATKYYGKKYIFLSFNDINSLNDYVKNNNINSLIFTSNFYNEVKDEISNKNIKNNYVLTEKKVNNYREGKYYYFYKFQNINNILEVIDKDINIETKLKTISNAKLITIYSPYDFKEKDDIAIKLTKQLNKKNKTLFIDLKEFENYKNSIGFSNIIFHYKENNLTDENIISEIINEDFDMIKSVSFPEDFSIINNIDLANIINYIRKFKYDYIIVNADNSYVKNLYLLNDSDKIILVDNIKNDNEKVNYFKNYITKSNIVDIKKIIELKIDKSKKNLITNLIKDFIYE